MDVTYCNIEEMRKTSSKVIHNYRDINTMNVKCVKVSKNFLSPNAAWLDGSFSRINHVNMQLCPHGALLLRKKTAT